MRSLIFLRHRLNPGLCKFSEPLGVNLNGHKFLAHCSVEVAVDEKCQVPPSHVDGALRWLGVERVH